MTWSRKSSGYGRDLYRDKTNGWILGVCAGIANAYDKPRWLIRILLITVCLFSGALGLLLYFGGYLLMDRRPTRRRESFTHHQRPVFDYDEPPMERAHKVHESLHRIDRRLQAMEHYVTSNRYKVNEAFRKL